MSSLTIEAAPRRSRALPSADLPHRWHWLIRGFCRYAHRYVRKHFHGVRLSASGSAFPPHGSEPLLVVFNHPSWWDPMMCIILLSRMGEYDHFAAIDARALERYRFFKKLGFVGVDTKSLRGAAEFLSNGATILSEPNRAFWVAAQGRFTDVRERPLALQSGVGHLAARLSRGVVLPVAFEYAFWTERTPEALIRIGEPIRVEDHPGQSAKNWLTLIEDRLTENLDVLNSEAMSRDAGKFTELISGRVGIGGPYDWWQRFKAWTRGKKFDPSHDSATREMQP